MTTGERVTHVEGGSIPIETNLAKETVSRAGLVAPFLIAIFWITRGESGALASAIGIGVVVAYYLVTGYLLSTAARISLAAYQVAAMFGFFLRLALITASMLIIAQLFEIDRLALGISVVAAYLVLLGWEAVTVARSREREW